MELDELKRIAREHGYFLAKIPEKKVKISPCDCGRKQISIWMRYDYPEDKKGIGRKPDLYSLACPKCGKKTGKWSTSEKDARIEWNKMLAKTGEETQ